TAFQSVSGTAATTAPQTAVHRFIRATVDDGPAPPSGYGAFGVAGRPPARPAPVRHRSPGTVHHRSPRPRPTSVTARVRRRSPRPVHHRRAGAGPPPTTRRGPVTGAGYGPAPAL